MWHGARVHLLQPPFPFIKLKGEKGVDYGRASLPFIALPDVPASRELFLEFYSHCPFFPQTP